MTVTLTDVAGSLVLRVLFFKLLLFVYIRGENEARIEIYICFLFCDFVNEINFLIIVQDMKSL